MDIYELKPFFEDTTIEVSMRDYARLRKIGKTKATRILKEYTKQNILVRTTTGPRSPYKINSQSPKAKSLAQLYWQEQLTILIQKIKDKINPTGIVLVNEISELTNTKDTKITLFLFGTFSYSLNRTEETQRLGRSIKLIACPKLMQIPLNYRITASNGFILDGEIL